MLGSVGLEAALLISGLVRAVPELPMKLLVGRIGAMALHRKLEEDGAHLGQQGAGLGDGVDGFGDHGQPRW